MTLPSVITVLEFIPLTISAASAALIVFYILRPMVVSVRWLWCGLGVLVVYHLGYPALLTVVQWTVWAENPLTQILLTLPVDASVPIPLYLQPFASLFESSHGYFAFYATRFWTTHILALCVAALIALCMALLKRTHEERLLVSMGILIAGWSKIVLFLPLLGFALLLLHFILRMRIHISVLLLAVLALTWWLASIPVVSFHLMNVSL